MEDIQQPISGLLVSTLLFNNKSTPNLESKEPWHPQPPTASGISRFFEALPLLLLFFALSFEIANLSIYNWRFILSFISFGLLAPFLLEAGINLPWVLYNTSRTSLNWITSIWSDPSITQSITITFIPAGFGSILSIWIWEKPCHHCTGH